MNRTFIVWTYSRAGVIGVVASEATAVQVPLEVIASTCRIVPSDLQQLALETVHRRMKTYRPSIEHRHREPAGGSGAGMEEFLQN